MSQSLAVEDVQGLLNVSDSSSGSCGVSEIAEPLTDQSECEMIPNMVPVGRKDASQEKQEHDSEASDRCEDTVQLAIKGVSFGGVYSLPESHTPQAPQPLTDDITAAVMPDTSESYSGQAAFFTAGEEDTSPDMAEPLNENSLASTLSCERKSSIPDTFTPREVKHTITQPNVTPLWRQSTPKHSIVADKTPTARDPLNADTPQIGTTLLRRESLRRKEDSDKKATQKGKSPHKKQLKKRDTLQEREILQRFSEATSPSQRTQIEGVTDLASPQLSQVVMHTSEETRSTIIDPRSTAENGLQRELHDGEASLDGRGSRTIFNADESCVAFMGITQPSELTMGLTEAPLLAYDLAYTNGPNQEAGDPEAQRNVEAVCEKTDLPIRQTRSGARFSDDTSILKDFLNKAQARKAAKDILEVPKSLQVTPRRSPRKAHGVRNDDKTSWGKSKECSTKSSGSRPGTSPDKLNTEFSDADDAEQSATGPASCRRSARPRLPAPSKTLPGAPSFIPVRRADGTDPVVLQKSQAQELAIATRANTRRNKGQSKAPLIALQDLPVEETESCTSTKQRVVSGKAVAWAERLASYQEANNLTDEMEDQRPKVRRMRGLGVINGIPTARRTTAVVPASNGTPAPKRRGKI